MSRVLPTPRILRNSGPKHNNDFFLLNTNNIPALCANILTDYKVIIKVNNPTNWKNPCINVQYTVNTLE